MKIYISGAFCVLVLAVFVTVTAISRRALPVGLVDVYGDTSGIDRLTIEGIVTEGAGAYGYRFRVCPEGASNEMIIFRSNQARANYVWGRVSSLQRAHFFSTYLAPFEPYHRAVVESDKSFYQEGESGQWIPMTEHRIYADVFEIVPRFHRFNRVYSAYYLAESEDRRLFVDAAEGAYIFSFHSFAGPHEMTPNVPNWSRGIYFPPIDSNVKVDDMYIFVPTGSHLFGSTAVYAVRIGDGVFPISECGTKVVAEVLFPIELERGRQNAILGLLAVDSSVLLMVQHENGIDVTRICIATGLATTVVANGAAYFTEAFISGNSVVFRGVGSGHDHLTSQHIELWAFDLSSGGIMLAAELSVELRGRHSYAESWFVQVFDAVYTGGHVYMAYMHSGIRGWSVVSDEVLVAAYDIQGQLVGLSQLLIGVEEDAHQLHFRRRGIFLSVNRRQPATISISADTH